MPSLTEAVPSRFTLHQRGTWSAREDRLPSAVWLAVLWVGMIAGFSLDFPSYLHETPARPLILHVHAVVFTVWLFLITAQVLFVVRDRVDLHRKLGWITIGWAGLMAIVGPWAAIAMQVVNFNTPHSNPPFVVINIADLSGFLVLLVWGIALRKNPAAHKRMMILANIALADPGYARFALHVFPIHPTSPLSFFWIVFYGNVLLLVLIFGWDFLRGRLMRSSVIAGVGLLASEIATACLYYSPAWKILTTGWVVSWVKHFA